MRFAEDANYFDTTVHPAKSQAEIVEMLEDFGTTNLMLAQGQAKGSHSGAGGKTAWLVRFEWLGRSYRFTFAPLECRTPEKVASFGGKKRAHAEQARYQMGRIAVHFVKAILTAAEAKPDALFGFVELPGAAVHPGGLPATAGELNVEGLTAALPALEVSEPVLLITGKNEEDL